MYGKSVSYRSLHKKSTAATIFGDKTKIKKDISRGLYRDITFAVENMSQDVVASILREINRKGQAK